MLTVKKPSRTNKDTRQKSKAENLEKSRLSAFFVASLPGFEPGAFRLGGGPSILLRYGTMFSKSLFYKAFEDSVIHHRGVWEWFLLIRKVDF